MLAEVLSFENNKLFAEKCLYMHEYIQIYIHIYIQINKYINIKK